MSDLTSELNLALAVDDDDQADYLVTPTGLRGSLLTIDGLFNSGTGHNHGGSHQGGSINPNGFPDGSINGSKLVDGSVYNAKIAAGTITADKLAPGALLPEALFAGTWTVQSANYVVAVTILWVFCTAAITVTLPVASANRPITVAAVTGTTTVAAAGGLVVGGSINISTGAVMNGTVSAGDSITYKSDGTNWRAV